MVDRVILAACGLVVLGAASGVVAADEHNTPPMADAGLDQTVTVGTTVYLDGGGSADPDGNISAFEWTVETPAGRSIRPDCTHCERTHFVPSSTGRYEVTLAVTDDDDDRRSDTLVVRAERSGAPHVRIEAPNRTTPGNTTVSITATVGDGALRRAHLYRDGEVIRTIDLAGQRASLNASIGLRQPSTHRIRTVVRDVDGRTTVATRNVTVHVSSGVSGTTGGEFDRCPHDCFTFGAAPDSSNYSATVAGTVLENDGGAFELNTGKSRDNRTPILTEREFQRLDSDGDGRVRLRNIENDALRNQIADGVDYGPTYKSDDYHDDIEEMNRTRNNAQSNSHQTDDGSKTYGSQNNENTDEKIETISNMKNEATSEETRISRILDSNNVSPTDLRISGGRRYV